VDQIIRFFSAKRGGFGRRWDAKYVRRRVGGPASLSVDRLADGRGGLGGGGAKSVLSVTK